MTPQSDPEIALLSTNNRRTALREAIPLLCTVLFFAVLFSHLLSTHMLQPKADGLYSGGSTWADLAWHLSMISNFVERGTQAVLENPVYTGTKLSYPFAPDLVSAWLIRCGLSMRTSLILPSFLTILGLVVGIYLLARRMGAGAFGSVAAVFLMMFNGSIVSIFYLWSDHRSAHESLWATLLRTDYSTLPDRHLQFSNFITDLLLPQRAADAGFCLGTFVVLLLWIYWEKSERKYLLYAGMCLASLPLIHFHTFVALGIVAALLVLIELLVEGRNWLDTIKAWIWFAAPMIVIAVPQMLWILPGKAGHFLRPIQGWMNGSESVWWFWLKNMIPHIFVFAAAFWFAKPKLKTFYLAFFGLFVVTNLVQFQPFIYDNIKLMFWWFLMSCVLTGVMLDGFNRRLRLVGIAISTVLVGAMVATGSLMVWREAHLSARMFSSEDIELAQFVKDHTSRDAIFLTSDRHTDPIACLAGRRIVMGFRGWLWTHGLNYRTRERDVIEMFRGSAETASLLKLYQVDYVLIERDKINDFHEQPDYYTIQFPVAYRSSNFTLVKVSP
jgi:hypothetical protein